MQTLALCPYGFHPLSTHHTIGSCSSCFQSKKGLVLNPRGMHGRNREREGKKEREGESRGNVHGLGGWFINPQFSRLFLSSGIEQYIVISSGNPDFPKQYSIGILKSMETFFFI